MHAVCHVPCRKHVDRPCTGTGDQTACFRKIHGWRSLVGYSPWSRKESDTTERLYFIVTMMQDSLGGFLLKLLLGSNTSPLHFWLPF